MNRIRDQLLAGAVLALNQDVRVARRHALDELEEVLHLLALADDVGEAVLPSDLLLQLLMLGAFLSPINRLPDHVNQAFLTDRLFEEVERARLPSFDSPGHGALAADDDDLRPRIHVLQPAQQRNAVNVGQHEVADDDVRAPLLEDLLAAGADQRGPDLVPLGLDHHLEPLRHRWLIIDGEYAFSALGN